MTPAAEVVEYARMTTSTSDFTITNLRDAEDSAPKFGLGDVQEARFVRDTLGCRQTGLSLQRTKPNQRGAFGHKHADQEEIYVVVAGSGRIALGNEVFELKPWDAVRVAPSIARGFEAGPDGLEFIAFGAPSTGENDAEMIQNFWPAEG